ncbi:MAG: phosphotransferase family protein [Janthinobacterium lividum]
MLNVDNTAKYLLERGLVTTEAILFDDLCVTTATRRNPNIIVTHAGAAPSLLIKQVDAAVKGADLSLGIEGAFYRFAEASGQADLIAAMTRVIALDEQNRRLLIAFLPGALTLWNYIRRFTPPDVPLLVFSRLGSILASLHAMRSDSSELQVFKGHLRSETPWALRAHRPTPDLVATLSRANFEILRIVQSQPELVCRLDSLTDLWRPTGLIHGDIKADNILVVPKPDGSGAAEVKLVDWELVQIGDPAWDLAGVLQDLVLFWINTMSPAESVDAMVTSAIWPWPAVQPAFGAMAQGYATLSRIDAAAFNALCLKAVRFCGARLIQTAFEMAQMSDSIPTASALLLQLSGNLLADPYLAQVQLFRLMSRVEWAA